MPLRKKIRLGYVGKTRRREQKRQRKEKKALEKASMVEADGQSEAVDSVGISHCEDNDTAVADDSHPDTEDDINLAEQKDQSELHDSNSVNHTQDPVHTSELKNKGVLLECKICSYHGKGAEFERHMDQHNSQAEAFDYTRLYSRVMNWTKIKKPNGDTQEAVTKTYICSKCSTQTDCLKQMREHLDICVINTLRFGCVICGEAFKKKKDVGDHMEADHIQLNEVEEESENNNSSDDIVKTNVNKNILVCSKCLSFTTDSAATFIKHFSTCKEQRVMLVQKSSRMTQSQVTPISQAGGSTESPYASDSVTKYTSSNDIQNHDKQQMETQQNSNTNGDIQQFNSDYGARNYFGYNKVKVENIIPDESLRNENFISTCNALVKEESLSHGKSDIGHNYSPVDDIRVSSDGAKGNVSNMRNVPVVSAMNNLVDSDGQLLNSNIPVVGAATQILTERETQQSAVAVDADIARDKDLCPRDIKIVLDRISADNIPSHSRKTLVSANTASTKSRKKKASLGTAPTLPLPSVNIAPTLPMKSVDTASFQSLLRGVEARGFSLMQTEKDILFLQHYKTPTPSVKLSVCIDEDFNCRINVHRQPVSRSHSIWKDLPDKFDDASSVMELLDRINKLRVCCGCLTESFHELVNIGGFLTNKSDTDTVTIVGYREGDFGAVTPNGHPYSSTIRSTKCALFIDRDANSVSIRCKECGKLNHNVRRRCNILQEKKEKKHELCLQFSQAQRYDKGGALQNN